MIGKKIIFAMLLFPLVFSGCFYVVAGAVGALGGYAISRDTIEGELDISFGSLWTSSIDVLDIMGVVIAEDQTKGIIQAEVNGAAVKVRIDQLTAETIRFRVTARKYLLPQLNIAQNVYVKIVGQAR